MKKRRNKNQNGAAPKSRLHPMFYLQLFLSVCAFLPSAPASSLSLSIFTGPVADTGTVCVCVHRQGRDCASRFYLSLSPPGVFSLAAARGFYCDIRSLKAHHPLYSSPLLLLLSKLVFLYFSLPIAQLPTLTSHTPFSTVYSPFFPLLLR